MNLTCFVLKALDIFSWRCLGPMFSTLCGPEIQGIYILYAQVHIYLIENGKEIQIFSW